MLARFDKLARAIGCAAANTESARRLGARVKISLQMSEYDLIGDRASGVAIKLTEQIAKQLSEK